MNSRIWTMALLVFLVLPGAGIGQHPNGAITTAQQLLDAFNRHDPAAMAGAGHDDLLKLFAAWRAFESPPLRDGAPDYTAATFDKRYSAFQALRQRLDAFDINAWPVEQQVDWHLVRAEMNGFDFNHRVLKPWVRDPAYYQSIWMERSDVPGHEGPTHHAVVEFWAYALPLSAADQQRLIEELRVIPPLTAQARLNLTGNARDLWVAGIRNMQDQGADLDRIEQAVATTAGDELNQVIAAAKTATDELVEWLEQEAPSKTGPSGIGKENYTWYQQNVHLVPLTWEDEVRGTRCTFC